MNENASMNYSMVRDFLYKSSNYISTFKENYLFTTPNHKLGNQIEMR